MSTGLIALLDDVVGLAKVAAASLDDVGAQAAKAGAKAAGVVIDDAAVTPRYVTGFAAERELPIIGRIALGSLKNKILYLLPAALALSLLAPWAITPLLMLGGVYLCFEGAEKIWHGLRASDGHGGAAAERDTEDAKVRGAIQTDFILSAEIMAITLASVAEAAFVTKAVTLAAVGVGITAVVYGAVALIVKADDAGVALARGRHAPLRAIGRAVVVAMPVFLGALSVIGTAAMVWVGGGIIIHGFETFGLGALGHAVHDAAAAAGVMMPGVGGFAEWAVAAAASGVFGLVIGAVVLLAKTLVSTLRRPRSVLSLLLCLAAAPAAADPARVLVTTAAGAVAETR